MNIQALCLGESAILSPNDKLDQRTPLNHPRPHIKILEEDYKIVTSPEGVDANFKVSGVGKPDWTVLESISKRAISRAKVNDATIVLGQDFYDSKTKFRVKIGDLVIVNDKNNMKSKLIVKYVIDDRYLLLCQPDAKNIGWLNLLKMGWHLFNK